MEGLNALDVVGELIRLAREGMVVVQDIAFRLGATIATISLLFALAVRIGGGASGAAAMILQWIISTGILVGGALTFWPVIMDRTMETAQAIAGAFGGPISAIDVIEKGYNIFARVIDNGIQGSIWNPVNIVQYFLAISAGIGLMLLHAALSLIYASAVISFWVGGAILPILIPVAMISGPSGVGMGVFAFVIAAMVRIISLGVIIGVGGGMVENTIVPGPGEEQTLFDLGAAVLSMLVMVYLAFIASSWASAFARLASPTSSLTGLISTVAVGGTALASGAAAAAVVGQAAAGIAAGGAARGGSGGGSAGGASGGGAGTGRGPSPRGTSYGGQVGTLNHVN